MTKAMMLLFGTNTWRIKLIRKAPRQPGLIQNGCIANATCIVAWPKNFFLCKFAYIKQKGKKKLC